MLRPSLIKEKNGIAKALLINSAVKLLGPSVLLVLYSENISHGLRRNTYVSDRPCKA